MITKTTTTTTNTRVSSGQDEEGKRAAGSTGLPNSNSNLLDAEEEKGEEFIFLEWWSGGGEGAEAEVEAVETASE